MPIYEYACEKCSHEFEVEQRITDAPVKSCPKCRARKVKRLISQTSFVLKGGGWYSDLYSSGKGDKGAGKSDAKDTGDASKSDASKSDGSKGGESKKSDASSGDSKSGGKKTGGSPKAAA